MESLTAKVRRISISGNNALTNTPSEIDQKIEYDYFCLNDDDSSNEETSNKIDTEYSFGNKFYDFMQNSKFIKEKIVEMGWMNLVENIDHQSYINLHTRLLDMQCYYQSDQSFINYYVNQLNNFIEQYIVDKDFTLLFLNVDNILSTYHNNLVNFNDDFQKYSHDPKINQLLEVINKKAYHVQMSYADFKQLLEKDVNKCIEDASYKTNLLDRFRNIFSNQEFDQTLIDTLSRVSLHFQNNVNLLYSFMLHSLGVKVLYSREVSSEYYVQKKLKLKTEDSEIETEIENTFKRVCLQTIAILVRDIFRDGDIEESLASQELVVQDIYEKVYPSISREEIFLILGKLTNTKQNISFSQEFDEFCKQLIRHSIEIISQNVDINKLLLSNQVIIKSEYQYVIDGFISLIQNELQSKGFAGDGKFESAGKMRTIKKINFVGKFARTLNKLKTLDTIIQQNKHKYVGEYLQLNYQSLKEEFIEDLKNFNNKEEIFEVLKAFYFKKNSSYNVVFLFKEEHRMNILNDYIHNIFHTKLTFAINSRTRRTLGNYHGFDPNGFTSFMSHVRLSNRSQIREIKNYKNISPSEANTFYPKESMYRVWTLFSSRALERLGVYSSNQRGSRKDMVDNAGSYKEVSSILIGYKNYFNEIIPEFINDSLIATWIKEIIRGEDELTKIDEGYYKMMFDKHKVNKLKEKLVGITYLLFGCEVARNPASIPIHHMMLDLIIDGRLSWSDALTATSNNNLGNGGRMPMSAKGAIAAGRRLNSKFASYLPWAYNYPGSDKDSESGITDFDMVARECWILFEWLELKDYNFTPQQIDIPKLYQDIIEGLPKIWS
ncbi:MAG: hypothetical protein ACK5Z5_09145 [Neisseriaceae bacterium]